MSDLPIITTPHAKSHLASSTKDPGEVFTAVHDLDFYDECLVSIKGKKAAIKVTGMPGKHVPPGPGGAVGKLNDLLGAVRFSSFPSTLLLPFTSAREPNAPATHKTKTSIKLTHCPLPLFPRKNRSPQQTAG